MAKIKSGFTGERLLVIPISIVDEYKLSTLGRNLYITDIGYFPGAGYHFCQRNPEDANQFILIYCIDGVGWFRLNQKTFRIIENQAFILPKNKVHSYGSSYNHPWSIYWIHFDGEVANFFAEDMDKPITINPDENSRIHERIRLFEEIYLTLKNGFNKQNLDYSSSTLHYFLSSIKFLQIYRNALSAKKNKSEKDVVDRAIHYMHENIHKKITVKMIADYIGLSTSHFSALFLTKTSFSPINYLNRLKIQEACHYLDYSEMKINQLSSLVGYEDPLYFSRIFTKIIGQSPLTYRKNKNNNP